MNPINSILKYRIHLFASFFLILYFTLRSFKDYAESDLILISLSLTSLTAFVYLYNKATDIKEDSLNRKKDAADRKYSGRIITASIIFLLLPMPYLIYFDIELLMLYLAAAFVGYSYSSSIRIGGLSIRLKEVFIIKNTSSAIVWSSVIVGTHIILRGNFRLFDLINFIVIFLIIFAVEIFWDIKDIKGDKKSGIRTIPNQLGLKWAKSIISILLLVSLLLMLKYSFPVYFIWAAILCWLFAMLAKESWSIFYYHSVIFIWIIASILNLILL
ncbi:UbiA family prenyltransferase [Candidatus Woesearchaeota archaeon]|nr:UbiA family prenyltransferase [Candidatus Woesearchaeota archaeon]